MGDVRHKIEAIEAADERKMNANGDYRVLAIDDSRINCAIIARILAAAGYEVTTTQSGPEGRKIAEKLHPHIILLDIEMPGEDGFITISKLKEHPETANIPVIFLSGVSDVDSKVTGFELGAVDFITKPFEPAEIRARTKLHIKMSQAMQAVLEQQRQQLQQLVDAQQQMLIRPTDMPDAKFAVQYQALHEAGGDFYSASRISEQVYGYFVGDVSGHDISTSYLTAAINVLLKQNCSPLYTPAESMRIINSVLRQSLDRHKFLAATYLQVDRQNREAVAINMGNPPLLFVPADGNDRFITARGAPLGMFPNSFYDSCVIPCAPGDRFYLFSDGMLEAQGRVWSVEMWRLPLAARGLQKLSLEDSIVRLREYFTGIGGALNDDLVILATEV